MAISISIQKDKNVIFFENIYSFFNKYQNEFSDIIKVLLNLDPYGDTPILEKKQLLQLCEEISNKIESVNDYRFFTEPNASKTRKTELKKLAQEIVSLKEELQKFASELSDLLKFALDNNLPVWAYGD